jgi:dihydroorotate dehydrogenase
VDTEPAVAAQIAALSDFLTATNTVAFGKLPDKIDWVKLFGSTQSPLANVGAPGGGGLSGRPLLPLVLEWIRAVRALGVKTPIIGGGGILSSQDALDVLAAGASAVFIGCVSMFRPWRVAKIIRTVNEASRG